MPKTNDTFKSVYDQFKNLEQPIEALKHYLASTPEEYEHHSLISVIVEKLDNEFQSLQTVTLKSLC